MDICGSILSNSSIIFIKIDSDNIIFLVYFEHFIASSTACKQTSRMPYPLIVILYCSKCKWQSRAVWYLQEILQTFDGEIKMVSLEPVVDQPGTFQVSFYKDGPSSPIILYKRRYKNADLAVKYGDEDGLMSQSYYHDGFPDSKYLKTLIRDALHTTGSVLRSLGHVDHYNDASNFLVAEKKIRSCEDCK